MLYFFHKFTKCGPLAQLGERYTGSVEVVGSIPIGSTISRKTVLYQRFIHAGHYVGHIEDIPQGVGDRFRRV